MDKQTLIGHLKLSDDSIDKLLEAAQLSPELRDFQPEQVEMLAAIAQLAAEKKVKTYKEAAELYRKPLREKQLTEIVQQHSIAAERVSEILAALKLKPEAITDGQLKQFEQICEQLQSGVELAAALPKVTKSKKPVVPEFVPNPPEGDQQNGSGALTVAEPTTITIELPSASTASLQDVANAAVIAASAEDISDRVAEMAVQISNQIEEVAQQMIMEAFFGEHSPVKPDASRAVARVQQLKAQRRQARG
jgi:hypothetical protein